MGDSWAQPAGRRWQAEHRGLGDLNDRVFEERQNRSWPDVLDDAERSYRAQTACIERLADEELLAFDRYDWLSDGRPLVTACIRGLPSSG